MSMTRYLLFAALLLAGCSRTTIMVPFAAGHEGTVERAIGADPLLRHLVARHNAWQAFVPEGTEEGEEGYAAMFTPAGIWRQEGPLPPAPVLRLLARHELGHLIYHRLEPARRGLLHRLLAGRATIAPEQRAVYFGLEESEEFARLLEWDGPVVIDILTRLGELPPDWPGDPGGHACPARGR